jgi:hypothetical protein
MVQEADAPAAVPSWRAVPVMGDLAAAAPSGQPAPAAAAAAAAAPPAQEQPEGPSSSSSSSSSSSASNVQPAAEVAETAAESVPLLAMSFEDQDLDDLQVTPRGTSIWLVSM